MKTTTILTRFVVLAVLADSAFGDLSIGWQSTDVGSVRPPGGAAYDSWNDVWTIVGDGWDIQSTADAFHFAYLRLFGEGQITARVVSITGTVLNEWAKAGVMIREDLRAGSKNAMMAMTPGAAQGHAAAFQWRATAGGASASSNAGSMTLPYWVRVERIGDTLKGYISPDGITWTQQGAGQTISMASNIYMGLAVTSHNAGVPCTATFDHVTVGGQWETIAENADDAIYRLHVSPFTAAIAAIHSHIVATGSGASDTDWVELRLFQGGEPVGSPCYGAKSPDTDTRADVVGEHDSLFLFTGQVVDYIDVWLHQTGGNPRLNRQQSYIRDYCTCASPNAGWGTGVSFELGSTDRACYDIRQSDERLRSWLVAKGLGCHPSYLQSSIFYSFDSLRTGPADIHIDAGYAGTIHKFVPAGYTGQAVYDVKVNADIGPAWNQQTYARTLNRWNYGLNEFALDTAAGATLDLLAGAAGALGIPGLDFVILAIGVFDALTVDQKVAEVQRATLQDIPLEKDQEFWAGLTLWAKVNAEGFAGAYVNFFSPEKMQTDMGPLAEYLIVGEQDLPESDRGMAVGGVLVYYTESIANTPPNTPAPPSGSATAATGASHACSTWAADAGADRVKYTFDWGDGSARMTTDLVNSGTIASATHVWNTAGSYVVKALATDEHDAQSNWSAGLTVTVTHTNRPPDIPAKPSGPTSGTAGTSCWYVFSTADPDGDSVKYIVDWGDGTQTTGGPYPPPGRVTAAHTWSAAGTYQVKVMATDEHGLASDWSDALTVTMTPGNRAPDKPAKPSGPTAGKVGTSYWYAFSVTDPDGDLVKYTVDWGDGTQMTSALSPPPGPMTTAHTWSAAGTYQVKVMATDEHGLASVWSDPLAVTIQDPPNIQWVQVEYWPTTRRIGDTLNLRGSYTNTSPTASAPAFKIGWEITKNGTAVKAGTIYVGALSPGGSGQFDFPSGYLFVPGSYQVKFTLDSSNQVAESDETDNVTTIEFSIEVPYSALRNGDFEQWGVSGASYTVMAEPTPVIPETPVPTYWTLATGYVKRVMGAKGIDGTTGSAARLGGETDADPGAKVRAELFQFLAPAYSPLTISFDAYGGNPWGPLTARVELYWYDGAGNLLPPASFSVPASADWKHHSFNASNPGAGVYLKLNLVRASWGYVVFDNMIVAGGPPY